MKTSSYFYSVGHSHRRLYCSSCLAILCLFLSPWGAHAQLFSHSQEVVAHDTIIQSVDSTITDSAEEVLDELVYEGSDEVSLPAFPGGMAKLSQFIGSTLRYPIVCMENGIQGRVMVKFLVTSKGEVKLAKVDRGVDPHLDAEALRVVKLMPRWIPGEKDGKPVGVWFELPIIFRLR